MTLDMHELEKILLLLIEEDSELRELIVDSLKSICIKSSS